MSLFDVTVLDSEELNILLLSNDYDTDYALSVFQETLSDEAIEAITSPENQEETYGAIYSYLLDLVPVELVDADDGFAITRSIISENSVILTIALSAEIREFIDETYPDLDDVLSVFNSEQEEGSDDSEDEVESEDDDWVV